MDLASAKQLLDAKAAYYESADFIAADPIAIPHRFSLRQDIEISGFIAATLAWGHRSAILQACSRILEHMDNAPYQFLMQHQPSDLKPLLSWVYRTFNATDLLYFIERLRLYYLEMDSLELAFFPNGSTSLFDALANFHQSFFCHDFAPMRTRKHVSTPIRGSACKRLCMYLRWMVRSGPVDFGIWQGIGAPALMIPLDTHTGRVGRRLGLLQRPQNDWKAVQELTGVLRSFCPSDPVRYDFALFGMGVEERLR